MKMTIPVSQPSIGPKEIEYMNDAIKSTWVSSIGPYITKFEENFARYCGAKYGLTTSNGTTALHLALMSLGITRGDEVIVPDLTFVATANAVKYTGAEPIFVDIDESTLCIDPFSIIRRMNKNIKAIIPVHIYGHPCDMDAINEIAKEYGLFVIEDAAEAHGAEYKGKRVGNLSDVAVFSFYGNKIITTGEGGMLLTNNIVIYEKAKQLRDHAMSKSKRYWHTEIGFNYRITNIQAALGLGQFERIDEIIKKKREIFSRYKANLEGTAGLKLNRTASYAKNVYWVVCLEIDGMTMESRDKFMIDLKNRGIDSRPYFYPISDLPMYSKVNTPIAHKVFQKGVILPSYESLSGSDVDYISESIKSILASKLRLKIHDLKLKTKKTKQNAIIIEK
ncbi:MAG: DegT/DnrJ/EryC1/StrS family aminotransferase [Sedimentisphaerales bacterium]|nr:DegT/DnrJ/EryC1/StrS family aminotransferase [Sedimentisphaerales bacterium]